MPQVLVPEPLITAQAIQERVAELGRTISEAYRGQSVVAVGILTGAFMFTADLVRTVTGPAMDVRFMTVASYELETYSSGNVRIVRDIDTPIEGRHVMIIEDIVDTGNTLARIRALLSSRNPASLAACALLDKPDRRQVHTDLEYWGFRIPDRFVVGYGLDYRGLYRNLDYIGVLPE